ncbi:glycosyltransferase family 39 protein [Candidatus Woesebacteria bacterium]|nr:glycosyltransferase family 39 protein [Candidatus Woesebacteria bacterium]
MFASFLAGIILFFLFLYQPAQPILIYFFFVLNLIIYLWCWRKDFVFKIKKSDFIIAVLLFAIALCLRLIKLAQLPFGFWLDEPDYALTALALLQKPIVPFTMQAIDGQMTPLLYLIGISIKLLGHTIIAVRLPTAIIAALNIPFFYFVMRLWVKPIVAFLAGLLLTFSYWHIVFSRIPFQVPLLILMEILTIGCLSLAFRENKRGYWVLVGICLGLSLYTYTPARWFVLLITIGLLAINVVPGLFRHHQWHKYVFFMLAFFLAASPLFAYSLRYPDQLFFRLNKLSLTKAQEQGSSLAAELFINSYKNIGLFWLFPDPNGRHNPAQTPALDPLTGILFVTSIGYIIVKGQSLHRSIIFFAFVMLAPAIFSFEGVGGENQPHFLRASGAIPFVYFSIGLFLNYLQTQTNFIKRYSFFSLAGIASVCLLNIHNYFAIPLSSKLYYEMNVREKTVGQLVAQTKSKTIVLSPYFARVPQVAFLKADKKVEIFEPSKLFNYLNNQSILLVLDINNDYLEIIKKMSKDYPEKSRLLTTPWNTIEAYTYERVY